MPKAAPKPTSTKTEAKKETEKSPLAPNRQVSLVLKWSEVEPHYQKVIRQFTSKTKLAGFRIGKAPTPLVIEHVGAGRILETTLDRVLPEAYHQLVHRENLKPLTQPDIHPKKVKVGEDWELTVEIAEQPQIDVKGYQKMVQTAKKAAEKDWPTEEAELKKANQDKEKTTEKAEAADLTQAKTDFINRRIYQELVLGLKPAIPELIVKVETRRELEELVKNLERFKLSLDEYLQRRQVSFEDLSAEMATNVLAKWQLEFIVQAIVDEAKLRATEAEMAAYLDKPENEQLKKVATQPQYQSYLESVVTREKLLTHFASL